MARYTENSIFLTFVAMSTRVFEEIKFFHEDTEENHSRNLSLKIHQNLMSSFREDV